MNKLRRLTTLLTVSPLLLLPGCTFLGQPRISGMVAVQHETYDTRTQTLSMNVVRVGEKQTGENVIDLGVRGALDNYVRTKFADTPVKRVQLERGTQTTTMNVPMLADASGIALSSLAVGGMSLPGIGLNPRVTAVAGINASPSAKSAAIMSVATSKMGAPYIWGHNEDRGQLGFDCSNFTEYVYHHALGYVMSTASQTQYHHVGVPISRSQARVGDLVIFESGKHVGIYAGNNRVIQDGGGLGHVGYISIAANAYWGQHITVFKRMF